MSRSSSPLPGSSDSWDCESDSGTDEVLASCFSELSVNEILDQPVWSRTGFPIAEFRTLSDLESYVMKCQSLVQKELESHDYNTFGSFVRFYSAFKKSGTESLMDFVSRMDRDDLVEQSDSLSCVGLAASLLRVLRADDARIGSHYHFVSCEESVKDVGAYSIESVNNLKEHVMLSMRFRFTDEDGSERDGYILLDPGYHVPRPGMCLRNLFTCVSKLDH